MLIPIPNVNIIINTDLMTHCCHNKDSVEFNLVGGAIIKVSDKEAIEFIIDELAKYSDAQDEFLQVLKVLCQQAISEMK